jgi:hypothetical protein
MPFGEHNLQNKNEINKLKGSIFAAIPLLLGCDGHKMFETVEG